MKKCLECDTIVRGRVDKKFCGDACRSAYNNIKNREMYAGFRRINRILQSNRGILHRLFTDKNHEISKAALKGCGFRIDYHTHSMLLDSGKLVQYCYDYGYLELENGKLAILSPGDSPQSYIQDINESHEIPSKRSCPVCVDDECSGTYRPGHGIHCR